MSISINIVLTKLFPNINLQKVLFTKNAKHESNSYHFAIDLIFNITYLLTYFT